MDALRPQKSALLVITVLAALVAAAVVALAKPAKAVDVIPGDGGGPTQTVSLRAVHPTGKFDLGGANATADWYQDDMFIKRVNVPGTLTVYGGHRVTFVARSTVETYEGSRYEFRYWGYVAPFQEVEVDGDKITVHTNGEPGPSLTANYEYVGPA